LQTRSRINDGSSYNLLINPLGGNVGIGTAAPGNKLHIDANGENSGIPALRINRETDFLGNFYIGSGSYEATNTRDFAIGFNSSILRVTAKSNEFRFNEKNNSPMTFYTANTERVRIDASGNVGIGTPSPDAKLKIIGTDSVAT
jgi:hypothetical protein